MIFGEHRNFISGIMDNFIRLQEGPIGPIWYYPEVALSLTRLGTEFVPANTAPIVNAYRITSGDYVDVYDFRLVPPLTIQYQLSYNGPWVDKTEQMFCRRLYDQTGNGHDFFTAVVSQYPEIAPDVLTVGPNKIINSTFDTDISDWVNYLNNYEVCEWQAPGVLHAVSIVFTGIKGIYSNEFAFTNSSVWKVSVDINLVSGDAPRIFLSNTGTKAVSSLEIVYLNHGYNEVLLTAKETRSNGILLFQNITSGDWTMDNVKIEEALSVTSEVSLYYDGIDDTLVNLQDFITTWSAVSVVGDLKIPIFTDPSPELLIFRASRTTGDVSGINVKPTDIEISWMSDTLDFSRVITNYSSDTWFVVGGGIDLLGTKQAEIVVNQNLMLYGNIITGTTIDALQYLFIHYPQAPRTVKGFWKSFLLYNDKLSEGQYHAIYTLFGY